MIRNIVIILLSLALLSCLYAGVYRWKTTDTSEAMQSDHPELVWLQREYQLTDEQFSEIRAKHEAHDIICRKLCFDLATAQNKLDAAIATYSSMSPEVEAALAGWTEQRQRCREATIAHMYDVSSVMEKKAAALYRERIFRNLIVPGRMPHIGKDGEFQDELIEHAAPRFADPRPSDDD